MKNKWTLKQFAFLFVLLLHPLCIYAQGPVEGIVVDGNGDPLPGVAVTVKNSPGLGVVTEADGTFDIRVKQNDVLVFSYLGLLTQECQVGSRTYFKITMQEDVASVEEIVVVGYGTQKRASITGAISSVSSSEILKAPTMSISNVIGSRVAGIAAVQATGQPGADNASLTIRGQGGIIYVIDGIRRSAEDFNGLDPNEIESISVLKDASAVAVYGLDANAAFVVTTKKGKSEKAVITYTGTIGISQNAEKQEWLDGPGYAYWYNKAREMQGDEPTFTAEQVRKMIAGVDGWGNTNWYDKVYGTGFRQHHNLSASGGTDKVRFFSSIGYLDEEGNIDRYNFKRYNLRSNVDAQIAKGWRLSLGVSGRLEQRNRPYFSADKDAFMNVPSQTCFALPYVPDTYEYEGQTYNVATPTNSQPASPITAIEDSGYSRSDRTYVQTDFTLQYDASWLPGLSLKFQGAYDMYFEATKTLNTPTEVLVLELPNAQTEQLKYKKQNLSTVGDTPKLSETSGRSTKLTSQTSISYNNSFGRHSIGALFLMETREKKSHNISASGYGLDFLQLDELSQITNTLYTKEEKFPEISGTSGHSRDAGFVGRLNYNFDDRYYLEASIRYDGSYLFGGMNKRWITLPGVSVAWRINKENWFNAHWVDNLKLRAGIGKTATSNGLGSFQWMNSMGLSQNSVVIGNSSQTSIRPSVLGNPYLTWAQCLNYNIGVDVSLWRGLLGMELDVFYKYEFDKLSTVTGAYPPSMGGYYFTSANVNEADYKGFDITLTHLNKIGSFNYGVKLIWSYAYGRWLKYAGDSENTPEYRHLTGKQVGSRLALIDQGLFQSEEEIANSAIDPSRPPIVGYIKYKDLNGDGVIRLQDDQGYFAKSTRPTHTGSFNLFGSWKGLDFDLLFSWGFGNQVALQGVYEAKNGIQGATSYSRPFYQLGNAPKTLVERSWTPENPDAEFPRIEISAHSLNNGYASTFWYRKGDYLRLKTVQIGYNFPRKWMSHIGVEGFRIYVEGYNLLTCSALTKFNIDPEAPSVNNGYYPQQRTFSIGVKLTF